MIVSHRHNFIFIKTKKTAGTSLEIGLSKFCGEKDIITGLPQKDEIIRKDFGGRAPQNLDIPWRKYTFQELSKYVRKGRRAICKNHFRARRIRRLVGRKIWKDYYKFCFERNPWDKAVSLYYWRTRDMKVQPSFSEFLHSSRAHKLSNYKLYSIWGRIAVDKIYKFETLTDALKDISSRLDLPGELELPRTKSIHRKDKTHYSKIISAEDREYIAKKCYREIKYLSYNYEDRID